MRAGVGPGAYAQRRDIADVTVDGQPRIVPLRVAPGFGTSRSTDVDPRGLPVVGSDGVAGGIVRDVWVDRAEVIVRYLEVEVEARIGRRPRGSRGTVVSSADELRDACGHAHRAQVVVDSIMGADFAGVPQTRDPDQITFLEEERVMAYYGAGTLYASPSARGAAAVMRLGRARVRGRARPARAAAAPASACSGKARRMRGRWPSAASTCARSRSISASSCCRARSRCVAQGGTVVDAAVAAALARCRPRCSRSATSCCWPGSPADRPSTRSPTSAS